MQKTRLLPVTEAAARWAEITGTQQPHGSTIVRWMDKGVRGIRLKGERIAGRRYVSPNSLEDFRRETSQLDGPGSAEQVAKALR